MLLLDTPYGFEFTTWELREDNTLRIRELLFGGLLGLPEGCAGASLGGFVFSFDPVERDLIPFGGDGVSDHIEYIQLEPTDSETGRRSGSPTDRPMVAGA